MRNRVAEGRALGGYVYASWPFGRLRVTTEQLTVTSVFFKPLVVTPANLVSITPFDYIPALGRGLRFEASDQDEATVFWTYRRSRIMSELAQFGWTVD